MYFTDQSHQTYYNHLTSTIYPKAKRDAEYHAMAYVLSVPPIYERCIEDRMFKEFPFLWTAQYEDKSYIEKDEHGEEIELLDFEVDTDEEGNEVRSRDYNTLSSGHQKLVELAMNLFNPSMGDFNLALSLGTWDDSLAKVYHQAVMLRINRKIDGLNINLD